LIPLRQDYNVARRRTSCSIATLGCAWPRLIHISKTMILEALYKYPGAPGLIYYRATSETCEISV